MEPDGSLHVLFTTVCRLSLSVAKLILSAPFLPVSLRLNIIFSSHLNQFLPCGVIPLAFNVLFAQEIPCCVCTQFLLVFRRAHISLYLEQNDISPHPEAYILKIHFNINFKCMPWILYWSSGILESGLRDSKIAQTLCASYCAQKTVLCTITLLV